MIHRVNNVSSGNQLMATNHSPLTYTQETLFEQAIGGPIAALWQTRQEGFVKGT
ncbi:lysophospholipase, partial [Vibrio sp. Vb1076]|nr:lysophospholipase [Vibrio sp. Vb1076]